MRMSERLDPKDPAPPVKAPDAQATVAYLPPAIAWEEPIEAIAAASCVATPDECQSQPFN
jgi:hypothetical protein